MTPEGAKLFTGDVVLYGTVLYMVLPWFNIVLWFYFGLIWFYSGLKYGLMVLLWFNMA